MYIKKSALFGSFLYLSSSLHCFGTDHSLRLEVEKTDQISHAMSKVKQAFEFEGQGLHEQAWQALQLFQADIKDIQQITQVYIKKSENSVQKKINKITQKFNRSAELKNELDGLNKQITTVKATIENLEEQIKSFSQKIPDLKKKIDEIENPSIWAMMGRSSPGGGGGLAGLAGAGLAANNISKLRIELEETKKQLDERQRNINNLREKKEGLETQNTEISNQIHLISDHRQSLQEEIDYSKTWISILEKSQILWNTLKIDIVHGIKPEIDELKNMYKELSQKVELYPGMIKAQEQTLIEALTYFAQQADLKYPLKYSYWHENYGIKTSWYTKKPLSLEVFKDKLYMGHVSHNSGKFYLASSEDGKTWTEAYMPNANWLTSQPIILKTFKDKLFIAYNSQSRLPSFPMFTHFPLQDVLLATSTNGLSWNNSYHLQAITNKPVTLEVFKDKLYLGYVHDQTLSLYVTSSDDGMTWTEAKKLKETWFSPQPFVLKTFKDKLFMAHNARDSKDIYLTSSSDGQTWNDAWKAKSSWQATQPLTLEVFNNRLYLGHVSYNSNAFYLSSSEDGKTWTEAKEPNKKWLTSQPFALKSFKDKLFLAHNPSAYDSIRLGYSKNPLNP